MRLVQLLGLIVLCGLVGACTRLKGVVLDERGRAHPSAAFSVGRPDGLGARSVHPADAKGRFDFSVMPIDENNVYIYDRAGNPAMTARRVDRFEFSDNMKVRLPRVRPDEAESFPDKNIPLD